MTRFEIARIVGARALQLSLGAPVLVELPPGISDPIEVAIIELRERILPMTIRRTLPEGSYQDISILDLIHESYVWS